MMTLQTREWRRASLKEPDLKISCQINYGEVTGSVQGAYEVKPATVIMEPRAKTCVVKHLPVFL
jgi:hypothetical protein